MYLLKDILSYSIDIFIKKSIHIYLQKMNVLSLLICRKKGKAIEISNGKLFVIASKNEKELLLSG